MKVSEKALEDLELIKAIKSEDKRIFEKGFDGLYKKYYNSMLFYFRGMMKNEEETKSLVLEAFTKASSNIDSFKGDTAAFSTWFFKLTRNLFIDKLRKRKEETISLSDITSFDDDGNIVEYPIICTDKSIEEDITEKERNVKILKIIDSMKNKRLSEIIKMRYYDEMSYKEISDKTGNSIGTIKALLYRTKQILREEFIKANICL
jgi:RNA polymerase sigma-70 factor (ECF subfamily)